MTCGKYFLLEPNQLIKHVLFVFVQQNNCDDDDWGEDFSEEAVKQRMEELSGAAKGLALTDDLEKTDKDRMDIVYKLVKVSLRLSRQKLVLCTFRGFRVYSITKGFKPFCE